MISIINGYDLKASFNTEITKVIKPVLAWPERKDSLQHDFPEENGIDKDLSTPAFSARTFDFDMITRGATIDELKANYFGLYTVLKVLGQYTFYNDFVDEQLLLYYIKQNNLSDLFREGEIGIAMTYTLTFGELSPVTNIVDYFLVDDQNRFLVP